MTGRTDRAERMIAATPEACFAAWTDADLLTRWLPPGEARAEVRALDVLPGGALEMTLFFEDGTPGKAGAARDEVRGTFAEVDPPHRLVLDVAFPSDDPAHSGTMRMDWRFDPAPGGTRASIAATGMPASIGAADHAAGLASSLDHLARLIEPT